MADDDLNTPYQLPPSLWQLIESCTSVHERPEVKRLLGESLVEQSLELHQEAEMLVEIWRDYRQETLCRPVCPRLPEPPDQREMLKAEIKFFVQSIQEKAKANGRDPSHIFSRHNSQILDYVLDSNKGRQSSLSIQSGTSSDGRETPLIRSHSRLSSASSARSDLSLDDIRTTLQERKDVFQFEQVSEHLRDVLEKEVEDLVEDIALLQSCLEGEVELRCESSLDREPTLADLRKERKYLEEELCSPDFLLPTALRECSDISSDSTMSEIGRLTSPELRPRTDSVATVAAAESTVLDSELCSVTDDVTMTTAPSSSSSRQSNDSAYNSTSSFDDAVSPTPSLALRHLIRSTAPPSHVTVRTGSGSSRPARLVHLATIPASVATDDACCHVPVPPSTGTPTMSVQQGPTRTGSAAQRFRNMVLECRDGD